MYKEPWSYFSTPELVGLLQQLKHLSQFSADALVIEAEEGAGKSSLISEFEHSFDLEGEQLEVDLVRLKLEPHQDLVDVLAEIAEKLGLQVGDCGAGAVLTQLRSYVENLFENRRVALILLDDAHYIEDDALGALLSLLQSSGEQGFGLRLLFFGQPGLMQRIDGITPPSLSIYDFQLAPFSTLELEKFLCEQVDGFAERQQTGKLPSIAAIWNRSGGRPGPALSLVQAEMSSGSVELASAFRGMPVLHLGLLSLLIAGLIITLLYRDEAQPGGGNTDGADASRVVINPESAVSAGPSVPAPATVLSMESSESVAVDKAGDSAGDNAGDNASNKDDHNPVNTVAESESASVDSDESGNDLAIEAPQPNLELLDDSSIEQESDTVRAAEADRAEVTAPSVTTVPTILNSGEQLLLAQSPSAYVLQLVAASKKEGLLDYMGRQPNKAMLHMYRRVKDGGGQWYIVVIGPYATKGQAQAARSTLPENQRSAGPWPKSIAAVKLEIEAFRDR